MNKTGAFVSSVMEQLISVPCDENRGLKTYCPFFHHFYSFILWLFKAIDLLLKWTNTAMIGTIHGLINKKTFWLSIASFSRTMSDTEKQAENSVKDLREQLQSMPVDMRIFSLCMRSLYSDQAVGTNSEGARKFRELRDKTRNDAMVYLKGVLPLSTKLVSSIRTKS